jgi:hypothetical protein
MYLRFFLWVIAAQEKNTAFINLQLSTGSLPDNERFEI